MDTMDIGQIAPDPKNPRQMGDDARQGLSASLEMFGALDIVFNERTGHLVSGHQRIHALKEAGATQVERAGAWGHVIHPKTGERFPIRFVDWSEEQERLANLTANNNRIQGEFTRDALDQLHELSNHAAFELLQLDELSNALQDEFGDSGLGDGSGDAGDTRSLGERFGVPPFSILDARQGYWQDRKRAWLAMGIQSELGRVEGVLIETSAQERLWEIQKNRTSPGGSPRPAMKLKGGKTVRGDGKGKAL